MTHSKIKWNINEIRSIENDKQVILQKTKPVDFTHWTKYVHIPAAAMFLGGF